MNRAVQQSGASRCTRLLVVVVSAGLFASAPASAEPIASTARAQREYEMLLPANQNADLSALLRYRGNPEAIGPDGAIGRNKERFSDVAAQRDALWALRYAIRAQEAGAARRAVDAIDYAFRHQNKEGYFDNGHGLDAVRAIEADAFFLAAYGQFYYLADRTTLREEIRSKLLAHTAGVRAALTWLLEHRDALAQQGKETPNRLLFDALAFLLNGQIVGDAAAGGAGKELFRQALAMQHPDGHFVEKGGHDTSYQAVCLLNLAAIHSYVEDPEVAAAALSSARAGLAWLGPRISDDGAVSVDGNTRTGRGQEQFFGQTKDVNYPETIYALFLWSALGDADYRPKAEAAVRHLRKLLENR